MDNRLGEMDVFLAVARQGSLAQVAGELRLTPSAASRALARLELRLAVRVRAFIDFLAEHVRCSEA